MLTLCIDSAYKKLTCTIIKDNQILAGISEECFQKQSENLFVVLDKLFKEAKIKKLDIDSVCISNGPGSYTGVRLAMSVAKVIAEVKNIDLYTISTLRLYASDAKNTLVIMDARANRAYVGVYDELKVIQDDHIEELEKIDTKDYNVILDGSLVNKENIDSNVSECFLKTKSIWHKEDVVSYVVPKYLKESDSYYR